MPVRRSSLVVLLAVWWAAGCARTSSVPIGEGVVTLDGRPLPNAIVDLVPELEADPPINGAVSDDEGRFRLRSRGWGRFTVVVTDGEPGLGKSRVPDRYMNPRTSPLQVVLPLEAPMNLKLERQ